MEVMLICGITAFSSSHHTVGFNNNVCPVNKPEGHWSCIAHLSAEDMLKSVVIEEKKLKNIPLSVLEQGQFMTLTFGTQSFIYSFS